MNLQYNNTCVQTYWIVYMPGFTLFVYRSNRDEYLHTIMRDNTQLLFNKIWEVSEHSKWSTRTFLANYCINSI